MQVRTEPAVLPIRDLAAPSYAMQIAAAEHRQMTEHKALGAVAGGVVGPFVLWVITELSDVYMAEYLAVLLTMVVSGAFAGAGAYFAPRNRFKEKTK